MQPGLVQKRIRKAPKACPGSELRGRTWYLQLYHAGQRQRRLGRDLDRAAVVLALGHRERMKQNGQGDVVRHSALAGQVKDVAKAVFPRLQRP